MTSLTGGSPSYIQVQQKDTSYQHGRGIDEQSKNSSSVNETSYKPCEWSIGWKTPTVIIGCYTVAMGVAVAHYEYYRYLDQQSVESTIPQSWNNGVSVAFVRIFSMALAASASSAFTQLLWWFLRRGPFTLKHIDAIFSLNTSGRAGRHRRRQPPGIPAAEMQHHSRRIVRTGKNADALVVQQLWTHNSSIMIVPTLDVNYRGDNTPIEFFENAYHMDDPDGNYQYVTATPVHVHGANSR